MTVTTGRVKSVSPDTNHPGGTTSGHDGAVGEDREDVSEGEAKTNVMRNPGSPTQEELDRHYVTHMPFRSWCPVCVQGKARGKPTLPPSWEAYR